MWNFRWNCNSFQKKKEKKNDVKFISKIDDCNLRYLQKIAEIFIDHHFE